jgi:hypothetical protein
MGETQEYDFDNFYVDCYTTKSDDILYKGSSPMIFITHNLMIFFQDGDYDTKKIYYNIKNNSNQIITIHDAFKQIDKQAGENMKNPLLEDYYNYDSHCFIEVIQRINDITFDMWCGS